MFVIDKEEECNYCEAPITKGGVPICQDCLTEAVTGGDE